MLLKNKLLKILLYSIIFYCITFGYYNLVSNGLGNKPFYLQLRRFIPLSLIFIATISILSVYTPKKFFITFSITSLSWALVWPITHKLTYASTIPFFSHHFDIVFAIYSFISLTSLTYLLTKFSNNKISTFFLTTLQFLLLIPPLISLSYYLTYDSCVSEAAVMALFQTNLAETKEYILQNLGLIGILFFIAIFFLIYISLYKINRTSIASTSNFSLSKKSLTFISIIALTCTCYTFTKVISRTGPITLITNVNNYFKAVKQFEDYHNDNFSKLKVVPPKKSFSKPSTIVLFIGESASRTYMSAFTKTERNTTPWLQSQKNNPNFYIFRNGYSSWGQTVPSLERALTEKNQYNEIDFNKSITIIDIAKKSGYHTSWFSNQGTIESADTPITLVGKTADEKHWTNESITTVQYDGSLLSYLKTIDPNKNNFVVFHLMGSHDNFQNRYPKEFAKWGNPNINEPILNYDNSLYYTDWIIKETFEYSKKNLNLQALIYFSDHGSNPNKRRHPNEFGFVQLRVPLFIYLSDEYKSIYPDTADALSINKNKYWTNDLTYDLVCGILNVKSPNFDETQSIASQKYKFTKETLRTKLGKSSLAEDN